MHQYHKKHDQYDRTQKNQSKFSKGQSFYNDSSINSPQVGIRTPKCQTERDSYYMSTNAMSPYLNTNDQSGGNFNNSMSNNQFNLSQNSSDRKSQQQRLFKNILAQQNNSQLNSQRNDQRVNDQQQTIYSSINKNATHHQTDQNKGNNHNIYNNKQGNMYENIQYQNNACQDLNEHPGMNSRESFSQLSGDFSQNGENNIHSVPIQQQSLQNPNYGIQKSSFGNYQNENKMNNIQNKNQQSHKQLNNKHEKQNEHEFLEKLDSISKQIKDLSKQKFSLDLSKLNQNIQNKIDSNRKAINENGMRNQFFCTDLVQSPHSHYINQNRDEKSKKRKISTKVNHHHKKSRNNSSSGSSRTSSYHSSSDNRSIFSSCSSSENYRTKSIHKQNRKQKEHQKHEYINNEKQNQTSTKKRKISSKQQEIFDDDILNIGAQCIKEINISNYLKDIFKNIIGSTEYFRRLLVEKKYPNALFGILKVFHDILGKINFNDRQISQTTVNSRISHSPIPNLNNTYIQNINSEYLTQSRFVPVVETSTPNQLYIQKGSFSQRNKIQSSQQNDNLNYCHTDRSYHNRSPSPLNTQSFVSTKIVGNYHVPLQYSKSNSLSNNIQMFNTSQHDGQSYCNQITNQHQKHFNDIAHEQNNRQNNQLNQSDFANRSNIQNFQHQTGLSKDNEKLDNVAYYHQQSYGNQHNRENKPQKNVLSELREEQIDENTYPEYQNRQFDNFKQSKQPTNYKIASPKQNLSDYKYSHDQQQKYQLELDQDYHHQNNNQNNKQGYMNYQMVNNQQQLSNDNQIKQDPFQNQNIYQNDNFQNEYQQSFSSPKFYQQNESNNSQQNSDSQNYNSPHFNQFNNNHNQNKKSSFFNRMDQNCQSFNPSQNSKPNQQNRNQQQHIQSHNEQKYNEQNQNKQNPQNNNNKYNDNTQDQDSQNNMYMSHKNQKEQHINSNKQGQQEFENYPQKNGQRNNKQNLEEQVVKKSTQNNVSQSNLNHHNFSSSPTRSNQYNVSSINDIESDSIYSPQRRVKNIETQKKQNKSSKSTNQVTQTKNKTQNKSFDVDDDNTSTHSVYTKQQVGTTPKQKNGRKEKFTIGGTMPCMRRASKNSVLTPSKQKGSQINIKLDYSNQGSYSNLHSKTNSIYSNSHLQAHDQNRDTSPIAGIENVGSRRRIQLEQRDYDIINGQSLTSNTPKSVLPQINIIDTEQTPQNQDKQKSRKKTPSLGSDNKDRK